MAFIETTPPDETRGAARAMLERLQQHHGYLPNYARVFTERPEIMELWAALQAGIRRGMDARRFELATFAAARALRSSYCALAHGRTLAERILSRSEMDALLRDDPGPFAEAERAVMALAARVAADASSVCDEDVARLRRAGLREDEIFDVVATAAARAFFSKLVEGLGAEPDACFAELDEPLRTRLTVGRPIASGPGGRLRDPAA